MNSGRKLLFLGLAPALASLSACAERTQTDDQIVQNAEDSFAKYGIKPGDITVSGLVPFYGDSGKPLFYYVWLRTGSCRGWFVQHADHPVDMFTLGECEMRTNAGAEVAGDR